MASENLRSANKAKQDEFYTQLSDIEKELKHYKEHFKDKIVFCNCDDPYESNFFKYFAMNFNHLGLKKLITTSYAGSPIVEQQLSLFDVKGVTLKEKTNKKPYKIEINEVDDYNKDGAIDLTDVEYLIKNKKNTLTLLEGDGDFRSEECIKLLKESDIVVTNPPFSLFREYVDQLIKYTKKFLIIGNFNAITYKDFFPLIKEGKVWTGVSPRSMEFIVPGGGKKSVNAKWFTNLDITQRHEKMILFQKYSEDKYQKYDNYDAININSVSGIPIDFDGVMGVPITFIEKYNPNQFKIIGLERYICPKEVLVGGRLAINGKPTYARILIKHIKPKEEENGN